MVYHGRVKNGQIVLDQGVRLPEGLRVAVDVLGNNERPAGTDSSPTLYEALKPFIGFVDSAPHDASENVDRDLYDGPRK